MNNATIRLMALMQKRSANESEKKALFGFGGSKPQRPKPLTPKEIAEFAAQDTQDASEEEHYNKQKELLKNLQKNKTQENIHNYLSNWMKVPGATNPNVKHDSFWNPSDSLETLEEDLPWSKKDLKSPYFQEDLSKLLYSPLTQSFKTDEDRAKAINEVASRFFPHIPKQVVKKASPAWQTSEGKSESGGLNDKGRASLKAQGHDIKRPQPEGGPRKDSFCARMKGMKSKLTSAETANDPDSRINKSLRKWKCGSASTKLASLLKNAACWKGYERVPGTKSMTPGSCRPVGGKKKEDKPKK